MEASLVLSWYRPAWIATMLAATSIAPRIISIEPDFD